jgi:hypothetical protein
LKNRLPRRSWAKAGSLIKQGKLLRKAGVGAALGLGVLSPALAGQDGQGGHQAFLYHFDSVSEDTARGDILYCMALARPALSARSKYSSDQQYGLVGAILGDLLGRAPTNRTRNVVMQRCMVAHGYRLYRVDQSTWNRLLGVDDALKVKGEVADAGIVDALSAFASRPLPADAGLPK